MRQFYEQCRVSVFTVYEKIGVILFFLFHSYWSRIFGVISYLLALIFHTSKHMLTNL